MFKYLLLILLGIVVWWAWRKRIRPSGGMARREAPTERMVSCARCGVHLPLSESLVEGEQHYCCEAHRQGGSESPSP